MKTLTTSLALALITATAACAAPSAEPSNDSEATSSTSEAVTMCSPGISAAAITKQIVSIEEPITLTVELVTISAKPFSYQAQSLTFPAGFVQNSIGTTSCTDLGASWKCRHQAELLAVGAANGTGAYSMTLAAKADANSGCTGGVTQRIDFSLQTESFAYYDVDGIGMAGIAIYGASEYGGWAYRFDEPGAWTFGTKGWTGLNDQISSVRVDRGWKVTLYEHANFTGRTKVITADTPFVGWEFNDITSAIIVSRL